MIRFKLKEVLETRGMTMYQLGKITGVRPNTISQWVNNDELIIENKDVKAISVDVLDSFCDALNCSISDLIEHIPKDN